MGILDTVADIFGKSEEKKGAQKAAKINKRIAKKEGKFAKYKTNVELRRVKEQAQKAVGRQRLLMAAKGGVVIDTGTPADIVRDTIRSAELDMEVIRKSGELKQYISDQDVRIYELEHDVAGKRAGIGMATSLLTEASSWDIFRGLIS